MTTTYSFSRISSLNQCGAKHAWHYYDKWRPDEEGIEAFVGKLVHECVEAHHKGEVQDPDMWEMFRDLWAKRYDAKRIVAVREEHTAQDRYQYGLKCIGNYLATAVLTPTMKLIGIEEKIVQPILASKIVGIIDRWVETPGGLEIHDFKSGKKPKRKWFEENHQLPLYAELARRHRGLPEDVEIPVVRYYLGFGKTETIKTDQARRNEAWSWAERGVTKDLEFEPRFKETRDAETDMSPLCGWCVYKTRGCPAWNTVKDSPL